MITPQRIDFLTTSKVTPKHGVAFPVVSGTGGYFTATEGLQTLIAGIKQLMLTNKGERVMMPEYGTSLRSAIFEPLTETLKSDLKEEIMSAIVTYEPRVVVHKIAVDSDERVSAAQNQIKVSLVVTAADDVSSSQIIDIIV